MALTQAQKKIISNLEKNPQEVLDLFKSNLNILKGFKNEYFQDGDGLLHNIAIKYLRNNESIYLELLEFCINNSTISIFDKKNNKKNVIEYLYDNNKYYNYKHFNDCLFKIIELAGDVNENNNHFSHYLVEPICNFYGDDNKFSYCFLKFKNILSSYEIKKIMLYIIDNKENSKNYINDLKFIINNINDKVELNNIDFSSKSLIQSKLEKSYSYGKVNNKLDNENIFIYSASNNLNEFTNFLLSKDKNLIYNKFKTVYYSTENKSLNPLKTLIINKDVNLLNLFLNNLEDKDFYSYLLEGNILKECLNDNNLKDIILNKLENLNLNLFDDYLISHKKSNLFVSIIESNLDFKFKEKYLIEYLKNTKENDYYHINNMILKFLLKNKNQEKFDELINFLDENKILNTEMFLNSSFNDHEFYKLIKNNNVLNKIDPFELIIICLKNTNQYRINNKNEFISILQDILTTKKPSFEFIQYLFDGDNIKLLSLINPLDIVKHPNIKINTNSYFSDEKNQLLNSLIDNNFKFLKNHQLESIISKVPVELLDKIIKKENFNINNLDKEVHAFWYHINDKDTLDYFLNAGLQFPTDTSSIEENLSLIITDKTKLSLYLDYKFPMTHNNIDGSILHYLVTKKSYDNDKLIQIIIDKKPDLLTTTNKQNKFFISYFIVEFDKLCRSKYYKSYLNDSYQKRYDSLLSIFEKTFSYGLYSLNPKASKILNTQLDNYHYIFTINPELKNLLEYGSFSKELDVKLPTINNNSNKVKKI